VRGDGSGLSGDLAGLVGVFALPVLGVLVGDAGQQVGLGREVGGPVRGGGVGAGLGEGSLIMVKCHIQETVVGERPSRCEE
jgi:hypothetical protein